MEHNQLEEQIPSIDYQHREAKQMLQNSIIQKQLQHHHRQQSSKAINRHAETFIYTCMNMIMHTYLYTYIHILNYTSVKACIRGQEYAHTYTHIHIYIYIYIY